jgi:hypothetical protein
VLVRVFPEPDAEDPLARRTVECELDVLNAGVLAPPTLSDAQMVQGAQDQEGYPLDWTNRNP